MTELTRRQLRELERTGQLPSTGTAVIESVVSEPLAAEPVIASIPAVSVAPAASTVITSRRQLREQANANFQAAEAPIGPSTEEHEPISQAAVAAVEEQRIARPEAITPRRFAPLPPVGSRRALREQVVEKPEGPENLEPLDVEIPEDGFRGSNYLAEPSTQSIMLDVAPEAISLPLDTGEVFTTGSIAILPESPGPSTGGLDGPELDTTEDAVTGVLSVVDPVPARSLIDDRSPLGVVPDRVLRKGWWRPWALGVLSIIMAIAAILASITILNALGE